MPSKQPVIDRMQEDRFARLSARRVVIVKRSTDCNEILDPESGQLHSRKRRAAYGR